MEMSQKKHPRDNLSSSANKDSMPEGATAMSVNHYDISNFQAIYRTYPNFMKHLKLSLKGRKFLVLNQNSEVTTISYENNPKRFLENISVDIIFHKPSEQSLLKAKVKNWNSFIKSLQADYFCSIFSEEDFSKTCVCLKPTDSRLIFTKISEFLNQNSTQVKISPHMMEFIRHSEKFSDLKLEETSEESLLAVKEEIKSVTCQSYLLDKIKFQLLSDRKEILSNIEETFNVKGEIFSSAVPLVVKVNPLTSISCILRDEAGNVPVDNLIILDHQKPSDDYILKQNRFDFKIWHKVPCEIPANQVVYAEISPDFSESKVNMILEDCLSEIYCGSFPVTVLGIRLCSQFIKDWKKFFESVMSTIEHLEREQVKIPNHYIMFIVENAEVLAHIKDLFANEIPLTKEDGKDYNITLIEGDLTEQKVNIVVNSTNTHLALDHGAISKALLAKAGPEIQNECARKYPHGLEMSELAVTKGYNLSCEYVIHSALSQKYQKSEISKLVYKCLQKAVDSNLSSIAFPALGTGNLNYPSDKVAEEMRESIETFTEKNPNHCLKEIKIVVFPGQPDIKKSFSNVFENDFEIVPLNPSSNTEEKWLNSGENEILHWILFVNYSKIHNNLNLAVGKFQEKLLRVPFPIKSSDLEQLLFFTNIFEVVPDIIEQYSEEKEGEVKLLIKNENLAKLQVLLKETLKNIVSDRLTLKVKLTKKQVEILLQKIQQEHPKVKCQILDNGKIFSFQSLSNEANTKVKCFLKFLLMSFSSPFSENQSNIDRQESEKLSYESKSLDPPYLELKSIERKVPDLIKNKDTTCFKIVNGFLIKVYEGDILKVNVDGIVNIISNWLNQGGKIAKAIMSAAGDVVQRECKEKLKDKISNEGTLISTSAGNLIHYKNIIHAFDSKYSVKTLNEDNKRKISETVYNSLMEADQLGLCSVALPEIKADLLTAFPESCTDGYLKGVIEFLKMKKLNFQLKEVHFVCMNPLICTSIRENFAKQLNGTSRESMENYIYKGKGIYPALSDEKGFENMDVDPVPEENIKCIVCAKTGNKLFDQKKCQHFFCDSCIKKPCPLCDKQFNISAENHPSGTMHVAENFSYYPTKKYFGITYNFDRFLNKGSTMYSSSFMSYLPCTKEGSTILKMLQLAFEQYLIFKVINKRLMWSDIPHKSSSSDIGNNDAMDSIFLNKVKDKLAEKGITPEHVAHKEIRDHIKLEQRII